MIRNPAVAALLLSLPVVAMTACSSAQNPSSPTSSSPAVQSSSPNRAGTLAAHLKTAEGKPVADATFIFSNGQVSVRIQTIGTGILAPGSHQVHIHEIGKCEPNSVGPEGGPPGNFLSAGGHYQAPGHTGQLASGDLPPLEISPDGSGSLQTTTDAFTKDQLLAGKGTALMIHGVGDMAMERVACGVIGT
ncbi:superoxide dismutase family protein [Mycobacterium sp. 852002-51163_SCH5372311]|uniref:superoxide dismutase family protein n=1 Tax=Mycobacterium sp. 852002-51163_SCH5372311 TaxID=1834097 RepID=UPI0009ED1F58|nr:superoxide dismutase family protein [Mycobacterium sp. 852002-51163_SCH5372311]